MIVQDINNDELITPSMNFDQVANTYSSFISTLPDPRYGGKRWLLAFPKTEDLGKVDA